ncbi:hypothetical protein Natpe_1566 [Natrinema pellirubrum DSM 15624]|uniref:Uncharacterized protein n=1 Tax=Natrinema pellirubrum (strain DSM 15624 / CIP 106293 / JCM 10476 / NCIMB 786 / 157) TaxID=797303 RepID=L0JM75_NATP1|nr:hypothetical protein Natpe_1566 [Natrinema pellirubrum DSM 15624]
MSDSDSDRSGEEKPDGVEENDDGRVSAKIVANSKGGSTSDE